MVQSIKMRCGSLHVTGIIRAPNQVSARVLLPHLLILLDVVLRFFGGSSSSLSLGQISSDDGGVDGLGGQKSPNELGRLDKGVKSRGGGRNTDISTGSDTEPHFRVL